MDPNTALAGLPFEIEELGLVDLDRAQEILDRFTALDEWITNGGFLPARWSRPSRPTRT